LKMQRTTNYLSGFGKSACDILRSCPDLSPVSALKSGHRREQHTGLFKEVKLNRGRALASASQDAWRNFALDQHSARSQD